MSTLLSIFVTMFVMVYLGNYLVIPVPHSPVVFEVHENREAVCLDSSVTLARARPTAGVQKAFAEP